MRLCCVVFVVVFAFVLNFMHCIVSVFVCACLYCVVVIAFVCACVKAYSCNCVCFFGCFSMWSLSLSCLSVSLLDSV